MFKDFSRKIKEKLIKISSTNGMNCTLNLSYLGQDITQCINLLTLVIPPQQGQQDGKVSNIIFSF